MVGLQQIDEWAAGHQSRGPLWGTSPIVSEWAEARHGARRAPLAHYSVRWDGTVVTYTEQFNAPYDNVKPGDKVKVTWISDEHTTDELHVVARGTVERITNSGKPVLVGAENTVGGLPLDRAHSFEVTYRVPGLDPMIEAAAKAIYDWSFGGYGGQWRFRSWPELTEGARQRYRSRAKAALDAAKAAERAAFPLRTGLIEHFEDQVAAGRPQDNQRPTPEGWLSP